MKIITINEVGEIEELRLPDKETLDNVIKDLSTWAKIEYAINKYVDGNDMYHALMYLLGVKPGDTKYYDIKTIIGYEETKET